MDPYDEAMPLNSLTPLFDTVVDGAQSTTGGALSNAICIVVPRMPKVFSYVDSTWLWTILGRRAKATALPRHRCGVDLSVPGGKRDASWISKWRLSGLWRREQSRSGRGMEDRVEEEGWSMAALSVVAVI